jgi:hypothetical protein
MIVKVYSFNINFFLTFAYSETNDEGKKDKIKFFFYKKLQIFDL